MFDFRHRCWRRFAKQGCLRLGLCTNRLLLDKVCYTHTNILMPSRKSTKVTAVYKNTFVKSQQNVRLKSITSVQNLLHSSITPRRPVSVSPPGERKKLFHVMFADSYEVETRRSRVCLYFTVQQSRLFINTERIYFFTSPPAGCPFLLSLSFFILTFTLSSERVQYVWPLLQGDSEQKGNHSVYSAFIKLQGLLKNCLLVF